MTKHEWLDDAQNFLTFSSLLNVMGVYIITVLKFHEESTPSRMVDITSRPKLYLER